MQPRSDRQAFSTIQTNTYLLFAGKALRLPRLGLVVALGTSLAESRTSPVLEVARTAVHAFHGLSRRPNGRVLADGAFGAHLLARKREVAVGALHALALRARVFHEAVRLVGAAQASVLL